jgi:hypothetical protein
MTEPLDATRRGALRAAAGALTAPVAFRGAAAANSELRAVVRLDGRTLVYEAQRGQDLGDFTSEIGGFTQRCIRVSREDVPLTVFFRPDRDSSRVEVVFELGRIWGGRPKNLDAYNVTIFDGERQLASVDVPRHYWYGRWRWESAPRPVVGDVDDLIARGLLPPYGRVPAEASAAPAVKVAKGLPAAGEVRLPPPARATAKGVALGLAAGPAPTGKAERVTNATYAIMELAGLEPRMGNTGERPDIGLVTEPQGRFICTGAADALAQVRAQAEAAGTLPWHMRDEKTGAPVDLDLNPRMSWYGNPRVASPHVPMADTGIQIDVAHQPSLAYVPFLLTGDPYHLEDLQFATNWSRGDAPPEYRFSVGQTRAFAWYIRNLAQCAKVTPAVVPRWLMPRSYWDRTLAQWQKFMHEQYVRSVSPERAVFRALEDPGATRDEGPTAPGGTYMPPWQSEFVACVTGWMVLMGFNGWKPFFDWQIASTIARTNGKSGWRRCQATPYRILLRKNASVPYLRSWREAWVLQAPIWGWEKADPDTITDQDLTYYFYTRAALATARRLKVPEADACLAWIESQLSARGAVLPYKWRLT